MTKIHSTAIIDPHAIIGEDCEIGPYAVIGEQVKIGRGTHIGAHTVIEGNTEIGENNSISHLLPLAPRLRISATGEKILVLL
jgi:UDP-N-acetylglucosamine acyltransferase